MLEQLTSWGEQKAIAGKEGLADMLESARREEPLEGWGGIKVATEDDL